jgi:hypothetical protein
VRETGAREGEGFVLKSSPEAGVRERVSEGGRAGEGEAKRVAGSEIWILNFLWVLFFEVISF